MFDNIDLRQRLSEELGKRAGSEALRETAVTPVFEFQKAVPFLTGGLADSLFEDLERLEMNGSGSVHETIMLVEFILQYKYGLTFSSQTRLRIADRIREYETELQIISDCDAYRATVVFVVIDEYARQWAREKKVTTYLGYWLVAQVEIQRREAVRTWTQIIQTLGTITRSVRAAAWSRVSQDDRDDSTEATDAEVAQAVPSIGPRHQLRSVVWGMPRSVGQTGRTLARRMTQGVGRTLRALGDRLAGEGGDQTPVETY